VSLSGDIPVPQCRRGGSRQWGYGRSGFSNIDEMKVKAGIGSSKAQHGPLIVGQASGRRECVSKFVGGQIGRLAPVEDGLRDVPGRDS